MFCKYFVKNVFLAYSYTSPPPNNRDAVVYSVFYLGVQIPKLVSSLHAKNRAWSTLFAKFKQFFLIFSVTVKGKGKRSNSLCNSFYGFLKLVICCVLSTCLL